MRTNRGILALEGDAPNNEPVSEERIDAEAGEQQAELTSIGSEVDQAAESAGMGEAIDTMSDTVAKSVDAGTGLGDETAQVVEAALEHFCTRLGVGRKMIPAMESFEHDRLGQSKIALENLRDLSTRISKNLAVAQEGILDRIGNAFSRAFTSLEQIRTAVRKLKADQLIEERDLGTPAWGRVFGGITGKSSITGSDIAKVMTDVEKNSDQLAVAIDKAASKLEAIRQQLDRKTFGAADGAAEAIHDIGQELNKILTDGTRGVPDDLINDKSYASVMSCDKSSFSKITAVINDARRTTVLEKAWERYHNAMQAVQDVSRTGNVYVDLAIKAASNAQTDRRATNTVLNSLNNDAFEAATTLLEYRFACMHGAYKYLLASTRK